MSRKWKQGAELFLIGSVGYSILEILWRGNTHWTMSLTGGVCFLAIFRINTKYAKEPWWKRCVVCSWTITAVEFLVGCVVNLGLGWNVWNYERLPLNLLGQICPLFSVLWFLLAIPLQGLTKGLQRRFQAA